MFPRDRYDPEGMKLSAAERDRCAGLGMIAVVVPNRAAAFCALIVALAACAPTPEPTPPAAAAAADASARRGDAATSA